MPNFDANFYNNQTAAFSAKAQEVAAKMNRSNFVVYKNNKYFISETSTFISFNGKTYMALDDLDVLKSGKTVGEVSLIKEGENDYSDNVHNDKLQTLKIYRRLLQYYIENMENEEYMKPMCRVR